MVLLLNQDWMDHLEARRLLWLQAYAAVCQGRACWFDRWTAAVYGHGEDGVDQRFVDGRLTGSGASRQHRNHWPGSRSQGGRLAR